MLDLLRPDMLHHCCKQSSELLSSEVATSDKAVMKILIDNLRNDQSDEIPVRAAIIHPQRGMIANTSNQSISQHDASAHAEILAIRQAGHLLGNYRLNSCTLYVTLEPCMMCFYALMHARISRIVFAAPDVKVGALSQHAFSDHHKQHNHHFQWTGGVMAAESKAIIDAFFAQRRKPC